MRDLDFSQIAQTVTIMTFFIGSKRFGIDCQHLRNITPVDDDFMLFTGLSAEEFINITPDIFAEHTHELTFSTGPDDITILNVTGPVEMLELDITALHPLPPLYKATTCLKNISGLAKIDAEIVLLATTEKLMGQNQES